MSENFSTGYYGNSKVLKYKVIGSDKDLEIIKKKVKNVCIGIGQLSLQNTRSIIFKRLKILPYF